MGAVYVLWRKVMKKIIVASTDPMKYEVVEVAAICTFREACIVHGIDAEAKIPSQSFDGQVLNNAHNRLIAIRAQHPDADIWVSIEDGLFHDGNDGNKLFYRAWILATDASNFIAKSSTASFEIPLQVSALLQSGKDLRAAIKEIFFSGNSYIPKDCIHFISDGLVNYREFYLPAANIALTQLKHKEWYRSA